MGMGNMELKDRIELHRKWLNSEEGGKKFVANAGENLRSANLRFADLSFADLRFADLRSANLRFADLSSVRGFKFTPLQIVNTKYFVTIFDDHVIWGCRKMTFEELRKFDFKDCTNTWDANEFKLNKKIITEMIRYYRSDKGTM